MPNATIKHSRSSGSLVSFEVLVRKVKETLLLGRRRVKQEMVRSYWQAGKYIHQHTLHYQDRADYGAQAIAKLAKRVEMKERSLQRMLQVYRRFPKIPSTWTELEWSHFRTLAAIPDETIRREFTERAVHEKWTARELESKMKSELRSESDAVLPAETKSRDRSLIARPKLGSLYTYRLVRTPLSEALKIDQGFSVYKFDLALASKLKAGDIVESKTKAGGNYSAVKSGRRADDLFTYKAFVERVIDGDTLFVEIDLGFTNTVRQYLRLRALDTPEMNTAAGRRAKDFVSESLKDAPFIFITSTRSDKFDRYLADVFIPGKNFLHEWGKGTAILSQSSDLLYLNNALLSHRLAVRMSY